MQTLCSAAAGWQHPYRAADRGKLSTMAYSRHRRPGDPSKLDLRREADAAVAAWRAPPALPATAVGKAPIDMREAWLDGLRTWAEANGNVSELWLFGSRISGTPRPDSDLDVAVFSSACTLREAEVVGSGDGDDV